MNYHYLDGLEKKGPFTIDELKGHNLSIDTLVYCESIDGWRAVKDIVELKSLTETPVSNESLDQEPNVGIEKPTLIKIPAVALLFLSYLFVIICAYFIVNMARSKDLAEMNAKIQELVGETGMVTDYVYNGTDGQLADVYVDKLFETSSDYNVVKTGKRLLAIKPLADHSEYEARIKIWKLYTELVQYYENAEFTGFNVLRLERNVGKYYLTESWSGDMAYKVPENRYIPGYSGYYINTPGYTVSTHRPSIGKCYEAAAKFLTAEREDNSYKTGTYNRISSFPDLVTNYYKISKIYPFYKRVLNKVNMDIGNGRPPGILESSGNTSHSDASVYNNQWIVWYKEISNKYIIEEKDEMFYKYWIIYSLIGIALASVAYFIVRNGKRIRLS